MAFKAGKLPNFAHFVGDAIAASDGGVTEDEVKRHLRGRVVDREHIHIFRCDVYLRKRIGGIVARDVAG